MSELRDLMDRIGNETVQIIKSEIESQGLVVTGALRDSIDYELIEYPDTVDVSFRMIYYGEFLDKGTIYIDPHDFFQVNIQKQLDKYSNQIALAFGNDLVAGLFK